MRNVIKKQMQIQLDFIFICMVSEINSTQLFKYISVLWSCFCFPFHSLGTFGYPGSLNGAETSYLFQLSQRYLQNLNCLNQMGKM